MKIGMIAAIGKDNNVIGKNGDMPWGKSLKEDLQFFKEKTVGKTIVMGRKTFESLGSKPLPNRINIVISTTKKIQDVLTYSSLEECLNEQSKILKEDEEIMIIGGSKIYEQCLNIADTLYLTLVQKQYEGDTFFPKYEHLFKKVESKLSNDGNLEFSTFKKIL